MRLSVKQFIITSKIMEEIGRSIEERRKLTLKEAISKVYRELDDELGIEENRKNAERDLQNFMEMLISIARERVGKRYDLEVDHESGNLRLYHEDGCCSLDPLGEIFLEGSKKVVNLFYEMLADMENHISHKGKICKGKIRIGTIQTLGVYPVPRFISEFNSLHNNSVAFKVSTGSSNQIKEWLCSRAIDIGFVSEKIESYGGYSNLKIKPFEEPLCICPRSAVNKFIDEKGNLKAEGTAVVDKLPLIYFSNFSSWRSRMEEWIADEKLEPSPIIYEADNMEIILSMVDKGIGRSVVPSRVLYRDKDRPLYSNVFCYKKIDEKLVTRMIMHKKPDRLVKKFVDFMQDCGYCY